MLWIQCESLCGGNTKEGVVEELWILLELVGSLCRSTAWSLWVGVVEPWDIEFAMVIEVAIARFPIR
jgi:hypothetical protein